MKYFAIMLDAGTPLRRNAITKLIQAKGWGFWHWIDDFWFVAVPDVESPKTLHTLFVNEVPLVATARILIFETKAPITFWGRLKANSWKWLKKNIGQAG